MNRDEMTKDLSQQILKVLVYGSTLDPDDVVFIDYTDFDKDSMELKITYE